MNLLQANSCTLPTVPRPPVDLHIYFITYERAAHTLMAFSLYLVDGCSGSLGLDVALDPLICDYAARLHLYSSCVLIPM